MSLAVRIILAFSVLTVGLGCLLGSNGIEALHAARQAAAQQQMNLVSDQLVRAAGAMAVERGLTNGLLANPGLATPAVMASIQAQRATGDAAVAAALAGLAQPGMAAADTSGVVASRAALLALRGKVDQVFAQRDAPPAAPGLAAPGLTPAVWFAGATRAIDAAVALRRATDADGSAARGIVLLGQLRDRLAEMSEFAGRERGMVNGLIAQNAKLGPPQFQALGALGGRVDGAWAAVAVHQHALEPRLRDAVALAERAWFVDFAPTRRAVLDAAAQGGAWPLAASEWFAQSSRAIDALLAAQSLIGEAIVGGLAAHEAALERVLWLSVALLLGAACLLGGMFWNLRRRVVQPLRRTIAVINQLAAGDLEVTVPPSRASDEIGQLLRATAHFRDTARQAHDLQAAQAAQAELRRASDAARLQAVRDIGEMIDDVSEQAVHGVQHLAGQLRELADQVHGGATAIAGQSGAAAGDATQGQAGMDAVGGGTRDLSAAIREIAEQMDRTATATRATVARTTDARRVFDALSVSVSEIGEVAGLISQIAGRTNLLALNATIEAARAGEAGKGFSVVASEVKALAQETARSTERISQRIGAIEAGTREAIAAINGIAGSVGELDAIASSVAAAIEEQSVATAMIAQAVTESNSAVGKVVARLTDIAEQTGQCADSAGRMAGISRDVAGNVASLKQDIVTLMRTRVAELDRRQDRRFGVALSARVEQAGGATKGQVIDIGASGARFHAAADVDLAEGARLVLHMDAMPTATAEVITQCGRMVHLHFVFASADQQQAMADAVERLALRAAA